MSRFSTEAPEIQLFSHATSLNQTALPSDQRSVSSKDPQDMWATQDQSGRRSGNDMDGWTLSLTAVSADQPERLVRFLTGALLPCGGWVLARATQGDHAAELDFEFARACCVEIYAVLLASGLELSRDSHLQMAELCHCTKSLMETHAFDIVHVDLTVYHTSAMQNREEYALALTA